MHCHMTRTDPPKNDTDFRFRLAGRLLYGTPSTDQRPGPCSAVWASKARGREERTGPEVHGLAGAAACNRYLLIYPTAYLINHCLTPPLRPRVTRVAGPPAGAGRRRCRSRSRRPVHGCVHCISISYFIKTSMCMTVWYKACGTVNLALCDLHVGAHMALYNIGYGYRDMCLIAWYNGDNSSACCVVFVMVVYLTEFQDCVVQGV